MTVQTRPRIEDDLSDIALHKKLLKSIESSQNTFMEKIPKMDPYFESIKNFRRDEINDIR